MLTASVNISKTVGHALVIGVVNVAADSQEALTGLGYEVARRDDPYAAMLELCRRPLVYRALVLSLQGLYRDELSIIGTVRRRFPHVSVYLADTDGRQAALAEAMRLGAEGLVDSTGLHSFAETPPVPTPRPTQFRPVPSTPERTERVEPIAPASSEVSESNEPVLTAEELRALLGE